MKKNLKFNDSTAQGCFFKPADDETEEYKGYLEEEKNKVYICAEDHRLREEKRRIFSLTDGSKQAEYYSNSVYTYYESKKMFDQIYNSMFFDYKGRCVRAGKNNFKARFSTKQNSTELLVLEKGIYKLKLRLPKPSKKRTKRELPLMKKKNTGKDAIVYEEFIPGFDLEYSLYGNGINQNIIIKKKQSLYSFEFEIEYKNLECKYDNDKKTIEFVSRKTGNVIFDIPAPFILDSRESHSNAVFCKIKTISASKALLKLTLDSSWVNYVYTLFPVNLNIQIEIKSNFSLNTYYWVNGIMGRNNIHTIGVDWASFCNGRMYIEVFKPSLPDNACIKKAVLVLPQKSSYSVNDFCPELGLYQSKDKIVLGKYTPQNFNESFGMAPIITHHSQPEGMINYEFDITSAIEKMCKEGSEKSVFVLKLHNESCSNTHIASFYGNICDNFNPKLVISYN